MTTLLNSEIKYNRETKDYDLYINGEYIGSASSYYHAEQMRTQALWETHMGLSQEAE